MAYPNLRLTPSKFIADRQAEILGKKKGKNLQIREGLVRKAKHLITLK